MIIGDTQYIIITICYLDIWIYLILVCSELRDFCDVFNNIFRYTVNAPTLALIFGLNILKLLYKYIIF